MKKDKIWGWLPISSKLSESRCQEIEAALAKGLPVSAKQILNDLTTAEIANLRPIRFAVFRTFSIEIAAPLLKLAFLRLGIAAEITWLDLNSLEHEFAQTTSQFLREHHRQPFHLLLIAWRLSDLLGDLIADPKESFFAQAYADSRQRIEDFLTRAQEFAPTFSLSFLLEQIELPTHEMEVFAARVATAHEQILLEKSCQNPRRLAVIKCPLDKSHFSAKNEMMFMQPFSQTGLAQLSWAVARAMHPWIHTPAKVLALDLDNTLWHGILGEDGIDGINCDRRYPGYFHHKLQKACLQLSQNSGVLLVLSSKNDESHVREAFKRHPEMPLKYGDFVGTKINWQNKSMNLAALANDLNLGLDAFVFLDDSSFERSEVRQNLPNVAVPEVTSAEEMLDYVLNGIELRSLPATQEDRGRSLDYLAERMREQQKVQFASHQDFLASLQLRAKISHWRRADLPRVMQLLSKTNQFNLTTQRHHQTEVESWIESSRYLGLLLQTADKFADQGIVGFALAAADVGTHNWVIDSFLLSCRALGRGFELALLHKLMVEVHNRGGRSVIASYIRTSRNEQTRWFYRDNGGSVVESSHEKIDFVFNVDEFLESRRIPPWISLPGENEKNG